MTEVLQKGAIPQDYDFDTFVKTHGPQLNAIPEKYWVALFTKLWDQVFDAGQSFKILKVIYDKSESEAEDVNQSEDNCSWSWKVVVDTDESSEKEDEEQIYLIDHAWTYHVTDARTHLENIPGLADRMAALMDIEVGRKPTEEITQNILNKMWLYNQVYTFGNVPMGSDEATPSWYIMDEFGSKIQHSDEPSFKIAPFYYVPEQLCYSVLWPVQENLESGAEVTRNYLEKEYPQLEHRSRLVPWQSTDLTDVDYHPVEPEDSYFHEYRRKITIPDSSEKAIHLDKEQVIKVFISYDGFKKHLTDPRFVVIDDISSADAIFVTETLRDFLDLKQVVNQFPNESVVTIKDLLALTGRRADTDRHDEDTLEYGPAWLPVTYNLMTELPQFVSYFQRRKKRKLNNLWICKPWNLFRGIDTHITDQLQCIVRLEQSGPKVACKYIEHPLLIHFEDVGDVKSDIRYILLLRSVQPLKLYAYRVFWLRFANKQYSLDHFDDYEKHFTVMNYKDEFPLRQVHYNDFIPIFNSQYPDLPWEDVEKKIFTMFRSLFLAASKEPYPKGIPHSPQSRAMYAADLMLKWGSDEKGNRTIQPVICEVNFSPDCNHAFKYHPNFANDVFSCLFLDDVEDRPITEI